MGETCGSCGGYCTKCSGMKFLVLGVLVLGKVYWWPTLGWDVFIGALLVLKGFLMIVKPSCGCGTPAPVKKKKK